MKKVGLLLKRYRMMGDITQTALAKEIGITKATLCRLEQAKPCSDANLALVIKWILTS